MGFDTSLRYMREHVLLQLSDFRARATSGRTVPPFIVGVQGPQGCGKTFLTSHLRESLVSAPSRLSVAVMSIDDLYLPHDSLVSLANANPDNILLHGRGQPGTHDVSLGTEIMKKLKDINDGGPNSHDEVFIPRFDKSLYDGEGDRVRDNTVVRSPLDIVILEGWCVGFYPTSPEEIERRWKRPVQGLGEDFFRRCGFKKEDIIDVNERLKDYVGWWDSLDAFIQIKPEDAHPYTHIYKWRLEQEHHMKSLNGGRGMTDDQVKKFVDRYIPGYVFFGDGVTQGGLDAHGAEKRPPWFGHGLRLEISETRDVVNTNIF